MADVRESPASSTSFHRRRCRGMGAIPWRNGEYNPFQYVARMMALRSPDRAQRDGGMQRGRGVEDGNACMSDFSPPSSPARLIQTGENYYY